ncbi:MAG: hypothetical protein C0426_09855 [Rhodobacter sp.]|nr:hypothetical protein [Rhodobacter sp.]MBS3980100.1 hypothetical protein [Paracoccaceae bacterium]
MPKGDIESGNARRPVTADFIAPPASPATSVGRRRKPARAVAAEGPLPIIGQAGVAKTAFPGHVACQSKLGRTREGLHARIADDSGLPRLVEARAKLVVS